VQKVKSDNQFTIAAPATASGTAALAILRVSGNLVLQVCANYLKKECPKPRYMYVGSFYNSAPFNHSASTNSPIAPVTNYCKPNSVLDQVTWVYYEAPKSYTGEPVLEIFCHGNPLIVQTILQTLLQNEGIRIARPGEFTQRALQNGRIDLIQAEAVADIIHTSSRAVLANAEKLLGGRLSSRLQELAQRVLNISVKVELEVDFAEEEADADQSHWAQDLQQVHQILQDLYTGFLENSRLQKQPKIVLAGAPNCGKSSLINALLGHDRILVSEEAGTTRDYIETRLLLPGGEVILTDTAGLSDSPVSQLDKLSMERSVQVLAQADLILYLHDSTCEQVYAQTLQQIQSSGIPSILVYTKSDLLQPPASHASKAPKALQPYQTAWKETISVSAQKGTQLQQLKNLLQDYLYPAQHGNEDLWLANARQAQNVAEAMQALTRALSLLNNSPELLAFELMIARKSLQQVIGEMTPDDVLHSIFSGFCIGK
jgi:tRNA modification GTPase